MAKAPCKDCPDRVVGCHGTCTKYQEFRKQLDAENVAQRKALYERVVLNKNGWLGLNRGQHKKR